MVKKCYFCSKLKNEIEKDHLPPKSWIPKELRDRNLKTYPICKECHDLFSRKGDSFESEFKAKIAKMPTSTIFAFKEQVGKVDRIYKERKLKNDVIIDNLGKAYWTFDKIQLNLLGQRFLKSYLNSHTNIDYSKWKFKTEIINGVGILSKRAKNFGVREDEINSISVIPELYEQFIIISNDQNVAYLTLEFYSSTSMLCIGSTEI